MFVTVCEKGKEIGVCTCMGMHFLPGMAFQLYPSRGFPERCKYMCWRSRKLQCHVYEPVWQTHLWKANGDLIWEMTVC